MLNCYSKVLFKHQPVLLPSLLKRQKPEDTKYAQMKCTYWLQCYRKMLSIELLVKGNIRTLFFKWIIQPWLPQQFVSYSRYCWTCFLSEPSLLTFPNKVVQHFSRSHLEQRLRKSTQSWSLMGGWWGVYLVMFWFLFGVFLPFLINMVAFYALETVLCLLINVHYFIPKSQSQLTVLRGTIFPWRLQSYFKRKVQHHILILMTIIFVAWYRSSIQIQTRSSNASPWTTYSMTLCRSKLTV